MLKDEAYARAMCFLCRLLGSNFVTPITTTTLSKLDSFERLLLSPFSSIGGLLMLKLLCSTHLKLLTYKIQSSSLTIGPKNMRPSFFLLLRTSPCTSCNTVNVGNFVLVNPHDLELIPLWRIRAKKQYQRMTFIKIQ